MNLSDSLQKYLDDVSSGSPTPGGGNVSAICGSLACSLGIMVCNLTMGKKKFTDVEEQIRDIRNKLEALKEKFTELAGKDNEVFDGVMAAFKLPKETEEQKNTRSMEIAKATLDAARVPAKVITASKDALSNLEFLALKGNKNSLSDAGVAVSLIQTAARGAFLNVLINYSSLADKSPAEELFKSANKLTEEIEKESARILLGVRQELQN